MKVNGPKYRLSTSFCIDQTIKQLVYGVLIYLPMQVLQVTGQKSDKSPPFSSVLHIMTSNPSPNALASCTKAHLSEKSSQCVEFGEALVCSPDPPELKKKKTTSLFWVDIGYCMFQNTPFSREANTELGYKAHPRLPGQGLVLHVWFSVSFPTQSAPPC